MLDDLCVVSLSQCFCVLSRCPSAVVEICYMLNVCVCCLVIPVR